MKKILFGLALFLPLMASATTFPGSGIDFGASTMTIDGPNGATCLTQDISTEYAFSLQSLGFTELILSLDDFGDWSTPAKRCFQKSGDYTLQVELFDKAGNAFSLPIESIHITSATPNEAASSFSVSCNGKIANATDICDVTLNLFDEFNNKIEQTLPGIELSADSAEFSNDANSETKFRAGLRIGTSNFTGTNPLSFEWNNSASSVFNISAIAPSLQTVDAGIAILSTVVPRAIEFVLNNIAKINTDGSVSSETTSFPDFSATLRFGVPVEIVPGFEKERIEFGDVIAMNNILDTDSIGAVGSVLSTFRSVSDHDFLDANIVPDEEGNYPEGAPLNEDFTFDPPADDDSEGVSKIILPTNAFDDIPENISLTTTARYTLAEELVEYPAGAVGQPLADAANDNGFPDPSIIVGFNTENVALRNIGVSVEGIVVGNLDEMYLVGGDNNKMTALSSLHTVDLREKIVKNAYRLIRNASNINYQASDFSWEDDFANQDVVIVDLSGATNTTLELSATDLPAGKKTLIVLNGNVLFTGDTKYETPAEDSFGLILMRDKAGPEPEVGNIFIAENVQKLSGTIFADGGIFSGNTVDLGAANTDTGGSRAKQLLITGAVFSRNTIGASMRVGTNGKYYYPWGTTTLDVAKRYDFRQLRQFDKDADLVADPANPNCVKNDSGDCDPNIAALIIRIDQKASLLAPPGFRTGLSAQ